MNQSISGPQFTALHAEIVERIDAGEFPSVSIGVIHNGRVLWCESTGLAEVEKNRPATPDTPYGLASLGKSITATAVMVLVDRFEIDLNSPISQYIGEETLTIFEGEMDQVTVRRVLNMTAAIPHGHMLFNSQAYLNPYSIDTLVQNRGMVVFPPGEVYLYSNFSYAILEKLIENVSGKPFNEFLQIEVFDPLYMKNTFISPNKKIETTAPVGLYDQNGSRLPQHYMLPRNSLAMYASLNDLLNYAKFHVDWGQFIKPPFSRRSLEKMHDLRGEAPGALIALGLASTDLDDEHCWLLTNGQAGGMQATLSMIPSARTAVICLVNSTGSAADDLAFRITDLLVPGFLDRSLQIMDQYESLSGRPYRPRTELLGAWEGDIDANGIGIPVRLFFKERGDILVTLAEGAETILNDVGYRNGLLAGDFLGFLPMEEVQDGPHKITLSLRLHDSQLSGFVTSEINNYRGNFTLAGYVHLSRSKLLPSRNTIDLDFSEK